MAAGRNVSFDPALGEEPVASGSSEAVMGTNTSMDPETARRLFEVGAAFLMLDVPVATDVGIDMNSWQAGEKFKGLKMIPPGLHFVYWSAAQNSPRSGFFHHFQKGEILVHRYHPDQEELKPVPDDEAERYRLNLQHLDRNLGAYPYDSWKKWVSLTNKISPETLARLEPRCGRLHSVSQLMPETHRTSRSQRGDVCSRPKSDYLLPENLGNLDAPQPDSRTGLPDMKCQPGTEVTYVAIPIQKYPAGSSPAEITKHSMDSTYQLEQYLKKFKDLYGDAVSSSMSNKNQNDEVLGELQFAFICFLVGQNYDSFEQWKQLLKMFLTCDEALSTHTDLYFTLIQDLHFQIREVPDDFFVDIVTSNNFLVSLLTNLFLNARENDQVQTKLKDRLDKFKTNLTQKFHWDFNFDDGDELDEEDRPVIVVT